jgi:hypothetical protein
MEKSVLVISQTKNEKIKLGKIFNALVCLCYFNRNQNNYNNMIIKRNLKWQLKEVKKKINLIIHSF